MQTLYVCFFDSTIKRLFFLKKGFKHVDLFVYDSNQPNVFIYLSPRNNRMYAVLCDKDYLKRRLKESHVWLHCELKSLRTKNNKIKNAFRFNFKPWQLLSCVAIAKYLLGLWNLCYTPYSLYKLLTKRKIRTLFDVKDGGTFMGMEDNDDMFDQMSKQQQDLKKQQDEQAQQEKQLQQERVSAIKRRRQATSLYDQNDKSGTLG